jgi:hypothetical protein
MLLGMTKAEAVRVNGTDMAESMCCTCICTCARALPASACFEVATGI